MVWQQCSLRTLFSKHYITTTCVFLYCRAGHHGVVFSTLGSTSCWRRLEQSNYISSPLSDCESLQGKPLPRRRIPLTVEGEYVTVLYEKKKDKIPSWSYLSILELWMFPGHFAITFITLKSADMPKKQNFYVDAWVLNASMSATAGFRDRREIQGSLETPAESEPERSLLASC